jgi:prepilin-type N-terminal cleavage/methylation domain-containing protein
MKTLRQYTLKKWFWGCHSEARDRQGFTLIELLVVLATFAVLTMVLLPALAGTRSNGKIFQCQNNLRRLTLGWTMYQGDNQDKLMEYTKWVYGMMSWSASAANTNVGFLVNSNEMAAYVKSAGVYNCPSDIYTSAVNPNGRVRSVALNGTLDGGSGSGPVLVNANGRTYFKARKVYDLNTPGPAKIFVILDEHPDSINDGVYMLDAGYAPGNEHWRDLPASHHNGAGSLSFADGHSEIHQWMEQRTGSGKVSTIFPVLCANYGSSSLSPWGKVNLGVNKDYEWMDDGMPYHY